MIPPNAVPLAISLVLCSIIALARVHDGLDRTLTRLAVRLFGGYVSEFRSERPDRQAALRAARFATTYREYGATTMLYATIFALVGSIVGIYVIWWLLYVLAVDPETMREALPGAIEFLANLGGVPDLSAGELFVLLVASCLTLGAVAGCGAYWLRWWYPSYVADARARRIEAGLPSTVAFMYALSQSRMAFPKVVRIVARQEATYGEAAAEFDVAVRNVDTFGTDVITAVRTMGRRSPSPKFQEFTENLVSVLRSGHSLSDFLEGQYHEFQSESESQQERTVELLGTLAEAYVTVLVAGPLFLITILVVIGISVGNTLDPLQALVYLLLPFGSLAFMIYLSMVTDTLIPGAAASETDADASAVAVPGPGSRSRSESKSGSTLGSTTVGNSRTDPRPDGGRSHHADRPQATIERVRDARRLDAARDRFATPIATLLERPTLSLAVTVPLVLGAVLWHLPAATAGDGFDATVIDDVLAIGLFGVLVVFAGFDELRRRRIEAVEAAIPDLLDRLASVNDAGMPLIAAVDSVRSSELGPLGDELDRVWADVQWGADLQTALGRFERRVRTRAASRVVTLLTEAMNASGTLGTVLTIAARQAATDRRLKRERKQAMVEYTVVVYIAFLVFLFIIAVLAAYLLPNLPTEGIDAADGRAAVGFDGFAGDADVLATYETVLYHATLVQGLLSGLIAGQLSTGTVKAGAKHAAAMIGLSILLFAVVV